LSFFEPSMVEILLFTSITQNETDKKANWKEGSAR